MQGRQANEADDFLLHAGLVNHYKRMLAHQSHYLELREAQLNKSDEWKPYITMDPLSITTAIITVGGTILGSLKILQTVLGASDEAMAINNEVMDIRATLSDVQEILKDGKKDVPKSLTTALTKMQSTSKLLNNFIHTRLLREEELGSVRLNKLVWLRERHHILRYQRELRTHRAELNMALSTMNVLTTSRLELSVANILAVTDDTRALLAEQGLHHQDLADEVRDIRHFWQLDPRRILWKRPSTLSGSGSPAASSSVFSDDKESITGERKKGLEVELLWQPTTACSKDCICECHRTRLARSPPMLEDFLGALFVGYTSLPFLRPACNVARCQRQRVQGLRLSWYFPSWFMRQMIAFAYTRKAYRQIDVSLKFSRVVDNGAPVFALAQRGDVEGLKALFRNQLASPLDVGHLDGCSALNLVVSKGNIKMVKFLLQAKADPDSPDALFRTARDQAWHLILLNSMPTRVTNYYRKAFPLTDMDDFCFSPVHEIVLDLKYGNLESAIERYPSSVNAQDVNLRSALMWASVRQRTESVITLLNYGADVKLRDKTGDTALMYAAVGGDVDCVRAIIEKGSQMTTGYFDMTALHKACNWHDKPELVRALLTLKSDINYKDQFGRSYLATAAWRNRSATVKVLLDENADAEALDAFGATPLLRAVRYGAVEAAQVLVEHGVNLTVVDSNHATILHRAASSRSERMIEFLADKVAPKLVNLDVEALDDGGMTAAQRLNELEPLASHRAAFTRLTSAILLARNRLEKTLAEQTILEIKSAESDDEDDEHDLFFDTSEQIVFA